MNRYSLLVASLTLALATVPAPGPAHATSIQKCQSADGSIFLDASYGYAGGALHASLDAGPMADRAGMLQLLVGDDDGPGADSIDFDVHRYAGCYFVSF